MAGMKFAHPVLQFAKHLQMYTSCRPSTPIRRNAYNISEKNHYADQIPSWIISRPNKCARPKYTNTPVTNDIIILNTKYLMWYCL